VLRVVHDGDHESVGRSTLRGQHHPLLSAGAHNPRTVQMITQLGYEVSFVIVTHPPIAGTPRLPAGLVVARQAARRRHRRAQATATVFDSPSKSPHHRGVHRALELTGRPAASEDA
jgi:hypothetical protein